jgi:hypothetical protein
LASLGLVKPIKDMGFQLEFNSLAHLVQKLTSYEQRHSEIYQDKFKRHITLVDTEDAEDSREEHEVAAAEWIRGANPVSYKWVKQQGPTKGFDFDESKVMTLGLKNAGTTYQCAMNYIYHDLIGKLVEIYNDNVVVKSTSTRGHLEDLCHVFE